MPSPKVLYDDNTGSVKLIGAVNDLTGAGIAGAVAQMTLHERQEDGSPGAAVGGAAWPIVMPQLAAPAFSYGAALPLPALAVDPASLYILRVTLDGAGGEHGEWTPTIRIRRRE
jgi:hypothetical protein